MRSGGGIIFVRAKFLADVFVVEAMQEACEALVLRQLLVLHQGVANNNIGRVLLRSNVTVLAFAHGVYVFFEGSVCVHGRRIQYGLFLF